MIPSEENRTLSDWTTDLLTRHELNAPDGRQIYQYRITNDEFTELEHLLRQYVAFGQEHLGFAGIARRQMFPQMFVLYCAEWWRRRYDGSGFSWEPILRDLRANFAEWNQAQRSNCVKIGLAAWRLRAMEGCGFRFLGSIAMQGGLPMKALATARGNIGRLLGKVLRQANNRRVENEDIENWIVRDQKELPKSYRQTEIFKLLAEVVGTILLLKQKANLNSANDAIDKLNAAVPGWRNQFPLPVEDGQTILLIEQLMCEAASIRRQKPTVCLPVERFLESGENDWQISSTINLPETIETKKLTDLFKEDEENLPRFAELSVIAADKTRTAQIRKLAGNPTFRLETTTWVFDGETALAEHILRLTADDGRIWTAPGTKGQPLDADLPWVFVNDGSIARFVGQGSVSVAENEAVTALPPDWKIAADFAENAEKIGFLSNSHRELFKVTKSIRVENSNGAGCRIRVQSVDEASENYEWRGQRFWLDFLKPSIAFKGKPNFFRVDDDGNALKINQGITCAAIGASYSNPWLGPVNLTFSEDGELKHKTAMTLLPQSANLVLKAQNSLSGTVNFNDWELSDAIVKTPNVNFKHRCNGQSSTLEMSVSSENRAPAQVTIEVFWHHTSTPARLTIPFPARGTRAFDSGGAEILNGSTLAVSQLIGTRLSVLGASGNDKRIQIILKTNGGKVSRKRILQTLPGAIALDVRLTDFLTDINHLLSLDDAPDSKVNLTLMIGNDESFTLKIARYENLMEKTDAEVLIAVEPSDVTVCAVRLEKPNEEPLTLELCATTEDGQAKWLFAPETREPGLWLIYPAADSNKSFRPTLWAIAGETNPESDLTRAIALPVWYERENALDKLIKEMAEDFNHSEWETVSRLANLTAHLPLTTLDLWRRFAHSAPGMAALAFRFGNLPQGFVRRFEKELPFTWEIIPFAVWKKAIRQSNEHCLSRFDTDTGEMLFKLHCERRIDTLTVAHGGLSFLLGIASAEFFSDKQNDFRNLRQLGDFARTNLLVDKNGHLMNLRRIHGEEKWFYDTDKILEKRWADARTHRYFHEENLHHQNDIINTPLLLAAESALGKSASWLKDAAKIHLLRTFRAFDTEWFDEAYNWTIVRCLADGLLDD